MKYNEEVLNISAKFYEDIKENEIDSEIEKMQKDLLPILLKKCARVLEDDKTQNKGIVKVKLISKFWEKPDDGYDLVVDLINANQFDVFASQYGFYLGNVQNNCNEYCNAYIEIVWDYKTYFESISMSQLDVRVEDEEPGNNAFVDALREFKQLPVSQQIEVLKAFSNKVDECKIATPTDEVVKLGLNGKNNN